MTGQFVISEPHTHVRREFSASMAVVFFGLLLIGIALCANVESTLQNAIGPKSIANEVRALNQENVAGPIDVEFLADCQSAKKKQPTVNEARCRNQVSKNQ